MASNHAPVHRRTISIQPSEFTLTAAQWLNGCTGSDRALRNFKNEHGASRLVDMALRCFVQSRRDLEDGTLDSIPWTPVGKRIWGVCSRHDLISVALWKHFAYAYSQEHAWPGTLAMDEKLSYQTPTIPPELFSELIPSALSSPRGLILTALTLRKLELSRIQWISLSKLDNLAILQLHGSLGHSFDLPTVRAWGDRASESGAFPNLRVLEMIDEDAIPFESLTHFSSIKSLQVIQWSGRYVTPSSVTVVEKYGWEQLCEHTTEDSDFTHSDDLSSYNWKRLCPNSCKKAENLSISLRENLNLPLLRARCSPRFVISTSTRFVAAIIPSPNKKLAAKRGPEHNLVAESSRPAPARRKPALRQGAKKDAADLFKQFAAS